jgi:DNA-binding HxlR family transcriptional regulator
MALLDLLGRRMSLRLLWELSLAEQPLTFRGLQAAAETNPGVLNTRLKELRAAGIVIHDAGGYGLSEEGKALLALFMPLHEWAGAWGARLGAVHRVLPRNAPKRRGAGKHRTNRR